ncbi:hypothetical protein PHYC_02724 [Phycisphaerales bacterium]|nr:hypothetical protein PHYC_02724 [Phycisphaerales bacterium]
MERSRRNAIIVAVVSGIATGCFAWGIAVRIGEFHKENPRDIYAFKRVEEPAFTFAGARVTLTDDRSMPDQPVLIVRYGEAEERLRVTVPGDYRLPKLLPHEDWMRILVFAPASRRAPEDFVNQMDAPDSPYRLVLITRTPRAGVDPKTWGAAWQRDWTFDFYEFQRQGGFSHERLRYPTTSGIKRPKEGELHENTWQYQAALQMMPKAGAVGPTRNFFGDALTAAGWLLPAAAFSGVGCTFATAFACAPRKRVGAVGASSKN